MAAFQQKLNEKYTLHFFISQFQYLVICNKLTSSEDSKYGQQVTIDQHFAPNGDVDGSGPIRHRLAHFIAL